MISISIVRYWIVGFSLCWELRVNWFDIWIRFNLLFLPLGDSFDSLARRTVPNVIEPLLLLFIIDRSTHYSTLSICNDRSINQSIRWENDDRWTNGCQQRRDESNDDVCCLARRSGWFRFSFLFQVRFSDFPFFGFFPRFSFHFLDFPRTSYIFRSILRASHFCKLAQSHWFFETLVPTHTHRFIASHNIYGREKNHITCHELHNITTCIFIKVSRDWYINEG